MARLIPTIGLCCLLLWVSTACTPKYAEFSAPSEHGYRVSLDVSDTLLLFGPGSSLPQALVVVRVRDAQGQPVDGIPVRFAVEPSWTENAALTPAETSTRKGEARAIFQANTLGVVHVMAQVDNVTREASITIASRPSPSGGGS